MAVIRALGYKQVGGYADEAADAASSPARCARGRRRQAHVPAAQPKSIRKYEARRAGRLR